MTFFGRCRELHRSSTSVFLDRISDSFVYGTGVGKRLTGRRRNGIVILNCRDRGDTRECRSSGKQFRDYYDYGGVFFNGRDAMYGVFNKFSRASSLTTTSGSFFGCFCFSARRTRWVYEYFAFAMSSFILFMVL